MGTDEGASKIVAEGFLALEPTRDSPRWLPGLVEERVSQFVCSPKRDNAPRRFPDSLRLHGGKFATGKPWIDNDPEAAVGTGDEQRVISVSMRAQGLHAQSPSARSQDPDRITEPPGLCAASNTKGPSDLARLPIRKLGP
jgi:hypothetical protein